MFVVANWGRLEMCGVGRIDAYVIGLRGKMVEMCMQGRESKWEQTEGVGHINKDLTNIMIMHKHSPELVLAGG